MHTLDVEMLGLPIRAMTGEISEAEMEAAARSGQREVILLVLF